LDLQETKKIKHKKQPTTQATTQATTPRIVNKSHQKPQNRGKKKNNQPRGATKSEANGYTPTR
jgi:hypothetical protein